MALLTTTAESSALRLPCARQGGPLHAGKHAERQAIDLQEFQDVDIILVLFAARMLGKMTRGAHQLPGEIQGQVQAPIAKIEVKSDANHGGGGAVWPVAATSKISKRPGRESRVAPLF